jgi:hypothetical protein
MLSACALGHREERHAIRHVGRQQHVEARAGQHIGVQVAELLELEPAPRVELRVAIGKMRACVRRARL